MLAMLLLASGVAPSSPPGSASSRFGSAALPHLPTRQQDPRQWLPAACVCHSTEQYTQFPLVASAECGSGRQSPPARCCRFQRMEATGRRCRWVCVAGKVQQGVAGGGPTATSCPTASCKPCAAVLPCSHEPACSLTPTWVGPCHDCAPCSPRACRPAADLRPNHPAHRGCLA